MMIDFFDEVVPLGAGDFKCLVESGKVESANVIPTEQENQKFNS